MRRLGANLPCVIPWLYYWNYIFKFMIKKCWMFFTIFVWIFVSWNVDFLMFVPSWRWFMIEFDTLFAEMEADRKGSTWLKLIQSSGFIWCYPLSLLPAWCLTAWVGNAMKKGFSKNRCPNSNEWWLVIILLPINQNSSNIIPLAWPIGPSKFRPPHRHQAL